MSDNTRSLWRVDGVVIVSLLAVTAVAWLVMRPVLSRSADESQAMSALVGERRTSADLSRTLAIMQTELRATRRELDTYNQPCWTDTDRSRRIEQLYALAKTHGLSVEGVEPGDFQMISGRRVLPLHLTARGPYMAAIDTLATIRSIHPDVVTRTLEVSVAPNTDTEILLRTELLWVVTADSTSSAGTASAR